MTTIERMARTLFWSRGGGNWIETSQLEKDGWINSAKSMLDDLREPDEAEIQKAMKCDRVIAWGDYDEYWKALITAIID